MKTISLLIVSLILLMLTENLSAQAYTSTKVFGQQELSPRELRKNAISGNLGWNGLTGIGVIYHNYLNKQMGIEAGLGLSLTGFKFGGRFSYYFIDKKFSPFIAVGFNYGTGLNAELEYNSSSNSFTYMVKPSPFTQISGGIEYIANGGFLFKANIGYAILLKESNYDILSGSPNSDEKLGLDASLGSGIVFELSFGYAFGNNK